MRSAKRDRRAHLSSTLRISAIICCRSASVFSGIHAGTESDVAGGSRNGEKRMNAPNIQKGGNTNKQWKQMRILLWVREKMELTKSEFEEIHRECYWLCIWRVFRQIGFFFNIGWQSFHIAFIMATVVCASGCQCVSEEVIHGVNGSGDTSRSPDLVS